jgi:hypothetical protein
VETVDDVSLGAGQVGGSQARACSGRRLYYWSERDVSSYLSYRQGFR